MIVGDFLVIPGVIFGTSVFFQGGVFGNSEEIFSLIQGDLFWSS